jgi:diaminohydroxyphosphoribosylaminopyrimidine deaminase/5-amino-6-(5-phosphoribosylamino)uracil reductase
MDHMKRALALADAAVGKNSPNPSVGAVVVKDGRIVGEGATLPPGEGHAEWVALRQAGEAAKGADLYTTLEPCCIQGKTPPCTDVILAAGVKTVYASMLDPNPRINGRGAALLREAGVEIHLGQGAQEAEEMYEGFAKFITTGLPFVTAKYAMSLDGKIATFEGDSQWITGPVSRRLVHQRRRASDAIMVGINTTLRDNPRLTARDDDGGNLDRQPLRVVVDSEGRTPTDAAMLRQPGRTLIATCKASARAAACLEEAGADVARLPEKDGYVDLEALLEELGRRDVVNLLVEGGGTLMGSLFDQGLVDKAWAFIAPIIIGGRDALSPVEGHGVGLVSRAMSLRCPRVKQVGDDVLVTGYPEARE